MVDRGTSDDRADSCPTDAIDPAPDDSPEGAERSELTKAPLLVLGLVFGGLLAIVTAKVVLSDGDEMDLTTSESGSSVVTPPPDDGTGSGDQVDARTERDDEAATPPGTQQLEDTQAVIETIAEGFVEDFSGLVDSNEALCMARTVVELLGVDRLWQMTEAMAERGPDPDPAARDDPRMLSREEEDRLNAALRPCVSEETAEKLNFG